MNKAITDGLALMPPSFAQGLDVWSREDGTPGSLTYAGAADAALVPADQDFGDCLELQKTESVQKLRHMGQTPIIPGCYLRVTARVKAVAGNLPALRIAAWAGNGNEEHVGGLVEVGPSVALSAYGQVETVTAIIGTGRRTGVDMSWGLVPVYAHLGLDLTGANGGIVRIDDLLVEDVTAIFLRDMMNWVDVRDYGALGDGTSDDSAAFEAADTAAAGREILIPKGTFHLGEHVTFENPVRFEGQVTMPADKRLSLTRNFDLPSYIAAFGNDLEAFKRAVAVLFNSSDHDSLDMGGRRVEVTAPIDMQAAVANKDTFQIRRVIRNGQFYAKPSPAWDATQVNSQATYSPSAPLTLSGVSNIANIPVGALVGGLGVGREIYVRAVNVGAGSLTLSQPLFDAAGTQSYTFTRFRYVLDFSGFAALDKFVLDDIEFQCDGKASAIMLPPEGQIFHVRDCFITKPRDRGITSIGKGCYGMLVDRCQFISNEQALRAQDRTTIAINVNDNDVKIRDNRIVRFAHFMVLHGSGHVIANNHWFQGDTETDGTRVAGIILTQPNVKTTITGNYIDNSFIEWTNEHDAAPDFTSEYSFGGLTVSGNIFTVNDVAPWFRWFVVKPHGQGHFIHGLTLSDNVFKSINGTIDRVDHVDTTHATLDMALARNITVQGNAFNAVDQVIVNPATLEFEINSPQKTWTLDFGRYLPFGGRARKVISVMPENAIRDTDGAVVSALPYTKVEQGTGGKSISLVWPVDSKGRVEVTARMDNPV
ncbi:pectate lyase-like protein [Rhodovulum bhavnagarense]|uniref:Pectate lyase-like protein n=1 Tax=Rhodovulum bhavnagarense TaxID=992286 RepID=A0A4R2RIC0_9RHOB|nr:glycosyl hydrolase family 28-related protein [Rhodovulum bhavnagarense]TCP62209.1 pectate lyase-like protein [Rhodovulum bhavnagarense]